MQTLYLIAGVVAIVTGAAHSVLGEMLIFRRLRGGGIVPANAAPPLLERHVRILWATWHVTTVFGWAFAAVLLRLAFAGADAPIGRFVVDAMVLANLAGAVLVFVGTKARHPGWIALSAVAALAWFAASAA